MLGNHVRPLPANKPGAILLLAHLTPSSSLYRRWFPSATYLLRRAEFLPSPLASLRRLRNTTPGRSLILNRAVLNAGADAVIAKTLDRDLGLVARHSANPSSMRQAALNLEAQGLGGCLRIGRNSNIDEIGHVDLPVSNVVTKLRHGAAPTAISSPAPDRAVSGRSR